MGQTLVKHSNGALFTRCVTAIYVTNGALYNGAPLLNSNGAPHVYCAISVHIIYSYFSSCDKTAPDPTFSRSPICINDPDYNFSVDLSLISMVESDPF